MGDGKSHTLDLIVSRRGAVDKEEGRDRAGGGRGRRGGLRRNSGVVLVATGGLQDCAWGSE